MNLRAIVCLSLLYFFTSNPVLAAGSEYAVTCNNCNSIRDFVDIAKLYPDDTTVTVVNTETFEAARYQVLSDPFLGKLTIDIGLSTKHSNAIKLYRELKETLSVMNLHSKFGEFNGNSSAIETNGCGAKDGVDVPDFIFTDACNNHDVCYAQGKPKTYCDNKFLKEIDIIIDTFITEHLNIYNYKLVLALFTTFKTYDFVAKEVLNFDTSMKAYCNAVPSREANAECISFDSDYDLDNGTPRGNTTFSEVDSGFSPSTGAATQIYITYSCELWSFPDGNAGQYYTYRNCKVSSYSRI